MEYEQALHGQVVETAYLNGDGDELILRMAHGGVVVVEGHSYEDVDLRLQSYTRDEWHARLEREQVERDERERFLGNAPPPDSLFLGPVIDSLRADINRQMYAGSVLRIPIRRTHVSE